MPSGKLAIMLMLLLIRLLGCNQDDNLICEDDAICQVTVYPNPTHDHVTVQFQSDAHTGGAVSILDVRGREQLTKSVDLADGGAHWVQFDLAGLEDGMYFVSVAADNLEPTVIEKVIYSR